MGCLKMLGNAPVVTADSAILAVLGIGLMLRDCKRVIEYEEDEALPDTPSYLANSFMDLNCMIKLEGHRANLLCTIVGLIEVAMEANIDEDEEVKEDKEEDGEDKDEEQDGEDKEEEEDGEDKEEGDKKEGVSDKVGDQESSRGDELQDAEGNVDIQMQEVQKNDRRKPEAEPKGKKRTRAQVSSRQAKKARIEAEEEPMRRSTRTRQPSKKVMQR